MPPTSTKTPNALLHGALDALILKTLTRGPSHGYAVARFIEETTGDAFPDRRRIALSGALSARAQGVGRGRVGHFGARPPRQVVSLDEGRTRAARDGNGDAGASSRPASRKCLPHEAFAAFVAVACAARSGIRRGDCAPSRDAHARADCGRDESGRGARTGDQEDGRCTQPQT